MNYMNAHFQTNSCFMGRWHTMCLMSFFFRLSTSQDLKFRKARPSPNTWAQLPQRVLACTATYSCCSSNRESWLSTSPSTRELTANVETSPRKSWGRSTTWASPSRATSTKRSLMIQCPPLTSNLDFNWAMG